MTRHGPLHPTVTRSAPEPTGDHVPVPGSGLIPGGTAGKTTPDCSLTPLEIALIRPVIALPAWKRLPSRTTPKPFCP